MNETSEIQKENRQIELPWVNLDAGAAAELDNLAELVRAHFAAPVALISLIDGDRQSFEAAAGMDLRKIARENAFCAHVVTRPDAVTVVEDARADGRFSGDPLVCGEPGVRFCAGAPIVTDKGVALGTVCVIDRVPRSFSAADRQALLRFAAIARSLIELHQRDDVLRRRNELHALYELAPGFIATAQGPDHRFTFANSAYKRLVGRDALVGLTVAEALPEIAEQGFVGLLDQVYRTGEPFVADGMPMHIRNPANGQLDLRYVSFVYQPVRDADNVITGLFCEGYDTTEQQRAAEALGVLQAALIHRARVNEIGMMATALAHELNQPLSAITIFAAGVQRMVANGPDPQSPLVQALHGIQDAAQRAAAIIRNLRDMTRRREPGRSIFDLKLAVDECIRLVRPTADPDIRITNGIADGVEMIADRVQIQQVVVNLVRNACDALATSARKDVAIDAQTDADNLIVRVTDTGPGLSAIAAEHAFSWSISTKEDGMGIGLSISRMIIEAHSGRIWLEPGREHGAQFCFALPLAPRLAPVIGAGAP
jgi:C4-dicarboxylate-specific signal transduction histidine kinase